MGFFNEFLNLFIGEELDQSFKLEMVGKTALMIEGYSKIVTLEPDEIVLRLTKGGLIKIKGAKLYIKKLEKSEVVIAGNILSFELC